MSSSNLLTGFLVAASFIGLSGCTIHLGDRNNTGTFQAGPVQTLSVNIPKPTEGRSAYDVELSPGIARVVVDHAGKGVLDGSIDYNVTNLKPIVTTSTNKVVVRTPDMRGTFPRNNISDWHISLGKEVPMNLTINTGATEGTYDFGGLSLRTFTLRQGAAKADVNFSESNPVDMTDFRFEIGAAQTTIKGLGNANIADGYGSIGAGELTLYFDGELSRSVDLKLEGGVSTITIYSGDNPVQVTVDGAMNSTQNDGWTKDGKTFTSPEWGKRGDARINIRLTMGIGTIRLKSGK